MKKMISSIAAAALCSPGYAAPQIMGLRSGSNGSLQTLGTPPSPPGIQELVPGTTPYGTWGATSVPGTEGTPDSFSTPGTYRKAIGSWAEVPYRPVTSEDREICALFFDSPTTAENTAGKKNPIAKVSFQADGGTVVDVTTPMTSTRMPGRDQLWCVNLNLTGLSTNQLVEIRATGYPQNGQPVVLQGISNANDILASETWSLPVVANYSVVQRYALATDGSDSNNCSEALPCKTTTRIKAVRGGANFSNVEICFKAGTYDGSYIVDSTLTTNADGFLTYRPCPGVNKNQVTVNSGNPRFSRLRFQGMQMTGRNTALGVDPTELWVQDVSWNGGSCISTKDCQVINGGTNSTYRAGSFLTESDFTNAFYVIKVGTMIRNFNLTDFSSDFGEDARIIINGTASNRIPQGLNEHADIQQVTVSDAGTFHIVYGLFTIGPTDAAGIFSSDRDPVLTGINNAAYVDVNIDVTDNPNRVGLQWRGTADHTNIFIWNMNLLSTNSGSGSAIKKDIIVLDSTCSGGGIVGTGNANLFLGSSTCD